MLAGSLSKCLPTADVVWFSTDELPARILAVQWLKGVPPPRSESGVPWRTLTDEPGALMNVIIGIDPHKATHTAVPIDRDEGGLAAVTVRATKQQTDRLVGWARPFEKHTWVIEFEEASAICSPNSRRVRAFRSTRPRSGAADPRVSRAGGRDENP